MIEVALSLSECNLAAEALEVLYHNPVMKLAHPVDAHEAGRLMVRLRARKGLYGLNGTEADFLMAALQWVWDNPVAYHEKTERWKMAVEIYRKVRDCAQTQGIGSPGWSMMFRPYGRPGMTKPARDIAAPDGGPTG